MSRTVLPPLKLPRRPSASRRAAPCPPAVAHLVMIQLLRWQIFSSTPPVGFRHYFVFVRQPLVINFLSVSSRLLAWASATIQSPYIELLQQLLVSSTRSFTRQITSLRPLAGCCMSVGTGYGLCCKHYPSSTKQNDWIIPSYKQNRKVKSSHL